MVNMRGIFCTRSTIALCFLGLTACVVYIQVMFGLRLINIQAIIQQPRFEGFDTIFGYSSRAYPSEETERIQHVKIHSEITTYFFRESHTNIFIYSAFRIDNNCDYLDQFENKTLVNHDKTASSACNKSSDIHIVGWEHKYYDNHTIKCCYLWEDGNISEFQNPLRHYYIKSKFTLLRSIHYECRLDNRDLALCGIHMQVGGNTCDSLRDRYIVPMQPRIPATSGMLAICLKILYGHVDVLWLVEWFEFYKEMKVDKVFLTVYDDASEQVRKVVQFYVDDGFVEMVPFDIPWKKAMPRVLNEKIYQVWDDKHVVVADFAVRYRKYTYTMVIDLDEFLLPAKGNMKDLVSHLMETYPNAGSLVFHSTMLLTSWGKSSAMYGRSVVSQYTRGTNFTFTRAKYIGVSNRLVFGSVSTHASKPMKGYRIVHVPVKTAVVYHYKSGCYHDTKKLCNGTRYNRTDILETIKKTEERSRAVKRRLTLI